MTGRSDEANDGAAVREHQQRTTDKGQRTRMQLAFSTNAYLRYPFDEAAERIAALGYQGLELLADVPHAWPAGLLDVQKRAIHAAMERTGLAFSNINAFECGSITRGGH
jgi:sugar phosphate isomerase/epimerase